MHQPARASCAHARAHTSKPTRTPASWQAAQVDPRTRVVHSWITHRGSRSHRIGPQPQSPHPRSLSRDATSRHSPQPLYCVTKRGVVVWGVCVVVGCVGCGVGWGVGGVVPARPRVGSAHGLAHTHLNPHERMRVGRLRGSTQGLVCAQLHHAPRQPQPSGSQPRSLTRRCP